MHAACSDAEISAIAHFACVPGKELPQKAPPDPIPVRPSPALADLHHAHPHSGFARRQHSAHVERPPTSPDVTVLRRGNMSQFCGESLTADHPSPPMHCFEVATLSPVFFFAQVVRFVTQLTQAHSAARFIYLIFRNSSAAVCVCRGRYVECSSLHPAVVPATQGPITTGHGCSPAGTAIESNNRGRWLWVPAFAGTTRGEIGVLEHDPEKRVALFSRDKRGTRLRKDHAQSNIPQTR